jgi:hypothetical protein
MERSRGRVDGRPGFQIKRRKLVLVLHVILLIASKAFDRCANGLNPRHARGPWRNARSHLRSEILRHAQAEGVKGVGGKAPDPARRLINRLERSMKRFSPAMH